MDDFESRSAVVNYWRDVHWSGGRLPEIGARGYFTLFVTQSAQIEAWTTISRLTQEDQLGYYSAIAPEPMDYG